MSAPSSGRSRVSRHSTRSLATITSARPAKGAFRWAVRVSPSARSVLSSVRSSRVGGVRRGGGHPPSGAELHARCAARGAVDHFEAVAAPVHRTRDRHPSAGAGGHRLAAHRFVGDGDAIGPPSVGLVPVIVVILAQPLDGQLAAGQGRAVGTQRDQFECGLGTFGHRVVGEQRLDPTRPRPRGGGSAGVRTRETGRPSRSRRLTRSLAASGAVESGTCSRVKASRPLPLASVRGGRQLDAVEGRILVGQAEAEALGGIGERARGRRRRAPSPSRVRSAPGAP